MTKRRPTIKRVPTAKATKVEAKPTAKPRRRKPANSAVPKGKNTRVFVEERTVKMPSKSKIDAEATQARKEHYLEYYADSLCNVSLACDNSGTARSTVYAWRADDPEFTKRMDDFLELRKDFYENALDKSASKGNVVAQIFFLKCRARDRGYNENDNGIGSGGVSLNREDLPDDALSSAIRKIAEEDPDFARNLLGAGN